MLQLTDLGGFGSFPTSLTEEFHGSTNDIANAASYTFTDHAIGDASADRLVVVIASVRDDGAGSPVIANLTIGGVAATKIVEAGGVSNNVQIWQRVVAAGTTATIAFDTGATCERANVSVYTLKNYVSSTPDDFDASPSADPGVTSAVTVQTDGVIIGGGISNGTGAWTTTGLTEDADQTIETARVVAASLSSNFVQTPTLTFDHAATATVVWASWH